MQQTTGLPAMNTNNRLPEVIRLLFNHSLQDDEEKTAVSEQVAAILRGFMVTRAVNKEPDLEIRLSNFRGSKIPDEPTPLSSYLDYLSREVVPYSVHTSSPLCLGNMTPAVPNFVQLLSPLIAAMNQNLMKIEASGTMTPVERQALAMMHRLVYSGSDGFYEQHIQDRESTLGVFVSGGTLANITAMWCARNTSLGPNGSFAGVESEGLPAALNRYGYQRAVIIGSEAMHYSFDKAAGLLGLGERGLIRVPLDVDDRINLQALRKTILDCHARDEHILALVGVAGSTDAGCIDPIPEMAAIAHREGILFHVDAAWAGPLLFSSRYRNKLMGIEHADFVTIDGHKQLYLPVGTGMLLMRDPKIAQAIEKTVHYTIREESFDLGKRSIEGSRAASALFLHAALNVIGGKGYAFLMDEGMRKAAYMAQRIRSLPNFQLLSEPQTNILLYRYIPFAFRKDADENRITVDGNQYLNELNGKLQQMQWRAGSSFVGRTTVYPARYQRKVQVVALRAVIANPRTTTEDIDGLLREQEEIASLLMRDRVCEPVHTGSFHPRQVSG
ncbi:MAG: aminotransferase class V-fold PLP-dependent enzyme [Planctomycetota bacterium]|jgi:glutamate decarboxylase